MRNVSLDDLSKFLRAIQATDKGPYDVTFHLAKDGSIHDFYLLNSELKQVKPASAPRVDDRALKAELTLRRIALVCLHARTTKDYESALANIEEAHIAWVEDKVDSTVYKVASGG